MRSRSAAATPAPSSATRERDPAAALRGRDADLARAGLAAVLDQDLEHRLDQLGGRRGRRQAGRQIDARPRSRRRASRRRPRAAAPRAGVAASSAATAMSARARWSSRSSSSDSRVGVGGGVGEEAAALLLAHRPVMVLQQLDRAADPGDRRLELVADRGGEIAQVARAALDPLGHRARNSRRARGSRPRRSPAGRGWSTAPRATFCGRLARAPRSAGRCRARAGRRGRAGCAKIRPTPSAILPRSW